MLTVKCRLPDEPRHSDDVCHWPCLQLDAIETQVKMFKLQQDILARLCTLTTVMADLTLAVRELRGAIGAGGHENSARVV